MLSSKVSVLQHYLDFSSTWAIHCHPSMSSVALVQCHCFIGVINPLLHPTEVNGILWDGASMQSSELLGPSTAPDNGAMCQQRVLVWWSCSALHRQNHKNCQLKLGMVWIAEPFSKGASNLTVFCFAFLYTGCLPPTLLMLLVMMLLWAFLI